MVSVPSAARTVDLGVVFEGRAQTISLLTGGRGTGAPLALYRAAPAAGIGQTVDLSVTLPENQIVRIKGTVDEVRLEAWRKDDGWAPPPRAYLSVTVNGWAVDRPCCRVGQIEVVPAWRAVLLGETTIDAIARPTSTSATQVPVFAVPEAFTEGRVELLVTVRYRHGGQPGEAGSDRLSFPVRIPA